MNILILNTSELTGGAAVAANRLAKALGKSGVEVSMIGRRGMSGGLLLMIAFGRADGTLFGLCGSG